MNWMKQTVFLLFMLLNSINGFCDTIDYWNVFINSNRLSDFNTNSKDLAIKIKKVDLKKYDSLKIKYFTDATCFDCYKGISINLDSIPSLLNYEIKEENTFFTFDIEMLVSISEKYPNNKIEFYYYNRKKNELIKNKRMLFELVFE